MFILTRNLISAVPTRSMCEMELVTG